MHAEIVERGTPQVKRGYAGYFCRTSPNWAYEGRNGCDLLGRVAEASGDSQRKRSDSTPVRPGPLGGSQRKDNRWEAAGYVVALGNTRKRIRVYGTTRKEALPKLTEKIAASNRGLPIPSTQGSVAAYLTY
jgi:hypothetical protein